MSSAPITDTTFLATIFWSALGVLAFIIFLASVLPRLIGGWYVRRDGIEIGPHYRRRAAVKTQQGRPALDPGARYVRGGEIIWRAPADVIALGRSRHWNPEA